MLNSIKPFPGADKMGVSEISELIKTALGTPTALVFAVTFGFWLKTKIALKEDLAKHAAAISAHEVKDDDRFQLIDKSLTHREMRIEGKIDAIITTTNGMALKVKDRK